MQIEYHFEHDIFVDAKTSWFSGCWPVVLLHFCNLQPLYVRVESGMKKGWWSPRRNLLLHQQVCGAALIIWMLESALLIDVLWGARPSRVRTHAHSLLSLVTLLKMAFQCTLVYKAGRHAPKWNRARHLPLRFSHSANVVRRQIGNSVRLRELMHNAPLSPQKSHCAEKGSAQIAKVAKEKWQSSEL